MYYTVPLKYHTVPCVPLMYHTVPLKYRTVPLMYRTVPLKYRTVSLMYHTLPVTSSQRYIANTFVRSFVCQFQYNFQQSRKQLLRKLHCVKTTLLVFVINYINVWIGYTVDFSLKQITIYSKKSTIKNFNSEIKIK